MSESCSKRANELPLRWERKLGSTTAQIIGGYNSSFMRSTRSSALNLLRGEHLLFVGDSLAAYQYLSLAFFLHTGDALQGKWNASQYGHPTILAEQLWAGVRAPREVWMDYYNRSSAVFRGAEVCDCFRDGSCHPNCHPQTFVGNRYFRFHSHGEWGRISFVPWLGDRIPPRWHAFNANHWQVHPCGNFRSCDEHVEVDLIGQDDEMILMRVITAMKPSFVQTGIHNHWKQRSQVEVCNFAQEWHKKATPPRAIVWKTNTPSAAEMERAASNIDTVCRTHSISTCTLPGSHQFVDMHPLLLQLADPALALPSDDLFVDALHYQPWVYHELNQVLLSALSLRRLR